MTMGRPIKRKTESIDPKKSVKHRISLLNESIEKYLFCRSILSCRFICLVMKIIDVAFDHLVRL
jgi:hypothetical protein